MRTAARRAAGRCDRVTHAVHEPSVTLLTYGRGDTPATARATADAAALRAAHHTVVVRSYPGGHQWAPGVQRCSTASGNSPRPDSVED